MSGFKSLHIEQWRQYKSVDIKFHPNLTIITGPNGTGKSTILSILGRHFGYNRNYLSIPTGKRKNGTWGFSVGIFSFLSSLRNRLKSDEPKNNIGTLEYNDGQKAAITVPIVNSISYNIDIAGQQSVEGIHIDSHRPPTIYRNVSHIPTNMPNIHSIASNLNSEMTNYYTSGNSNQGSTFHIKTALIAMSIFGHGNQTMEPTPELIEVFLEFEEKLRKILPKGLGFEKLIIRSPEVILSTKSGEFVLDAASGGVIKLFEITWQIFMFVRNKKNKVVITMDEPENHLHPSMQRTFLRDIMSAFPDVQFVVVSHSPFIVSSVRNSSVYVLAYESFDDIIQESEDSDSRVSNNQTVRVVSQELDTVNKAASATEILREALGVPTTIPDWAEDRLQEIISQFEGRELSNDVLDDLSEKLRSEGLSSDYPTAVQSLMRAKR